MKGIGRGRLTLRRTALAACALALVAASGGCSAPGVSPATYRLTAYFAKAPSLYEGSRVKVMGAGVGTITSIRIDRSRVRVELAVDRDVPVPAGVHAAIVATDPISERNIVLYPPWRPGMATAAPGSVIPEDRTELPVEVDQTLAAFSKLTAAVSPGRLRSLSASAADALAGRGDDINRALQATAGLTGDLAGQDRRLIHLTEALRTIATRLNGNEAGLSRTIDSLSSASRMLADERAQVQRLLAGMVALIKKSGVLITAYRETLPGTAADLSDIVMTLKGSSSALNQLVAALSQFGTVTLRSWDREHHVMTIRAVLNATLRAWLQPLFTSLGWGTVPCPRGAPNLANCGSAAPGKGSD